MRSGTAGRIARAALIAASVISIFGLSSCGKKKTTTEVSNAAAETSAAVITPTEAPTEPAAELSGAPKSEEEKETSAGAPGSPAASKSDLKTSIMKYEKGGIKVEYPVVSGLTDSSQQDKLNLHLKENALSILTSYPDSREPMDQEKDTLDISCTVISADTGRVTVVYEGYYHMDGAAYPINIFYTNTVNTRTLKDIALKDAADPYTMAAFALSEDVVFTAADRSMKKDVEEALPEWRKTASAGQYQEVLEKADFPLKKGSDGKTITWPSSFSYESEGVLHYSIPVPHAMGDFIVVEYDITTK